MMSKTIKKRRDGFTLAEVMIAMAIFTVGLIAVAALFPTGAILQKKTMDSVESRIVRNNALALLMGMEFKAAELNDSTVEVNGNPTPNYNRFSQSPFNNADAKVVPLLQVIEQAGNPFTSEHYLTLDDRSYPNCFTSIIQRDYFWVPFLKRDAMDSNNKTLPRDWTCFVFIMKREPEGIYNMSETAYPGNPGGYLKGCLGNPSDRDWVNDADDTSSIPVARIVSAIPNLQATPDSKFTFNRFNIANTSPGGQYPELVQRGDLVLDEKGNIHRVMDADASSFTVAARVLVDEVGDAPQWVWIVPRADADDDSPLTDIMVIKELVRE